MEICGFDIDTVVEFVEPSLAGFVFDDCSPSRPGSRAGMAEEGTGPRE
jgi:hypothetical protein